MAARTHMGGARRAVALIEVVIALAVVGVLLAVLSLATTDSRRNAQVSDSLNNLKQFAWAGSAYAADCNERFWTYSWRRFDNPTGQPFGDDTEAAAAQAADIIRRRSNFEIQAIPAWLPHLLYSHLILADHLNLPLPLPWSVSPGDDKRLRWHQCTGEPNPTECFLALPDTERPSGVWSERWMVSASYEIGPAFIARDQREGPTMTLQSALSNHYQYIVGNAPIGDRLMTQVAMPSRKVQVFESFQRYFGPRVAYYAYPEARVPLLMVDGSAMVRATSESNPGFYPNSPTNGSPLRLAYMPRPWEPSTLLPGLQNIVTGYYAWTRGGLTGNDFSAPEVCTGQPGCTP